MDLSAYCHTVFGRCRHGATNQGAVTEAWSSARPCFYPGSILGLRVPLLVVFLPTEQHVEDTFEFIATESRQVVGSEAPPFDGTVAIAR
jgi:hypothetical protein